MICNIKIYGCYITKSVEGQYSDAFCFSVVCQPKLSHIWIFWHHRILTCALRTPALETKIFGFMNFSVWGFLQYCNDTYSLKVKYFGPCDRCRHNKPPGSPVSPGVANTTALGPGFQQLDKRNMGGIVTLPSCHQWHTPCTTYSER